MTAKEQAFCREYVKNGYNATQAAITAGYSKKTARNIGSQNLAKIHIQERIEHHKAHLEELLNLSKSKVLREHMILAFSSIAHLHNTWIERKVFEELTDDQKACIAEIDTKIVKKLETEIHEGEIVKVPYEVEYIRIKLYDKQKALDSITKIMGYDAPVKAELSGTIDIHQITGMKVD